MNLGWRGSAVAMFALAIGILAGVVLPFGSGPAPAAACDYETTGWPGDVMGDDVRVEARWSAGGRIEVGVSQYLMVEYCEWGWSERRLPARRFVPADPPLGRWLNSSPIAAFGSALRVSARRGADGTTEFALQQEAFGKWQARRSVGAFLPNGGPEGVWRESPALEFWVVSGPSYLGQPSFKLERERAYFATLVMEDGGEIDIELLHDAAPLTVNWFIRLARDGYYDGRRFELVTGGGGYEAEERRADYAAYAGRPLNYRAPQIPNEYTGLPNVAGAVGLMPGEEAWAGTPEFYIKTEDYDREEGDTAWFADPPFVFGQVVSGLEHVRAMPAVDPSKREIGPRIQEVRIREHRRSVAWPAGVIGHGFRAGASFDGSVLGDPDAPVLVRKYVDFFHCGWCRMAELPVEQYLFDELVATGVARYEVIPQGGRDESVELIRALACATDQGRFWEFHDLLEAVWRLRDRSGYSPYVLARAAWMDASEFRACFEGGGDAGRIAYWQEQNRPFCGGPGFRCPVDAVNLGQAGYFFVIDLKEGVNVGGTRYMSSLQEGASELIKRARIVQDRLALSDERR